MTQGEPGAAGAGGTPHCYRHPSRETYISCQRCGRPICPDCMRDAAVGFHCPECVAAGRKSTRQGRTPYGGNRSRNPQLTSMVLIAINTAVWLVITATGGAASTWIDRLALLPRGRCDDAGGGNRFYPGILDSGVCQQVVQGTWVHGVATGEWWQLLTSTFTHVSLWHIGSNMLALWFVGPQLEAAIGRSRFLAVYLVSGLAGSTLVYFASSPYGETLGASGAVFGLLAALLLLAHKVGGDYQQILMWIGINFVITIVGASFISWQGHVGGFIGGLVMGSVILYAPRRRRAAIQWGVVAAVLVVLLGLCVLRTSQLTAPELKPIASARLSTGFCTAGDELHACHSPG